ncbi:hypothetical protein JG687_00013573 [Phytophthora cactorum]|uniref:Uncharacterized protein n=1 Tax=Phytophthora cactorum TaxID=29920 RepID=A0A8T1U3W1_9STRA|nr:hypothetical protein JG687_00013573 [Phytophthora cactorum]
MTSVHTGCLTSGTKVEKLSNLLRTIRELVWIRRCPFFRFELVGQVARKRTTSKKKS